MRKLILLPMFFGISFFCFGQDYIVIGDKLVQGKVSRTFGRSIFLQEYANQPAKEYSLDNISEYRTKWDIYEALTINGERKFYEQLAKGKTSLYKNGSLYAIKRDDENEFTTFDQKSYRETLNEKLDLKATDDQLKRVVYSKRVLRQVVRNANENDLNISRLPYRKFGVVTGVNFNTLKAQVVNPYAMKANPTAAFVGVFVDIPFSAKTPIVYINAEATYSKYSASFSGSEPYFTQKMDMNLVTKNLSVGIKLVAAKNKFGTYFKASFVGSSIDFKSPKGWDEVNKGTSVKHVFVQSNNTFHPGYSAAAGVQFAVVGKVNLHAEVRYTSMVGEVDQEIKLKMSSTGLAVGLSF